MQEVDPVLVPGLGGMVSVNPGIALFERQPLLRVGLCCLRQYTRRPSSQSSLRCIMTAQYALVRCRCLTARCCGHAHCQNLVAPAVDKTIRETIRLVDHAVSIAVTTSHELVTKDFISEPDVGKLTSAAHSLVGNLAASLVRFFCVGLAHCSDATMTNGRQV